MINKIFYKNGKVVSESDSPTHVEIKSDKYYIIQIDTGIEYVSAYDSIQAKHAYKESEKFLPESTNTQNTTDVYVPVDGQRTI